MSVSVRACSCFCMLNCTVGDYAAMALSTRSIVAEDHALFRAYVHVYEYIYIYIYRYIYIYIYTMYIYVLESSVETPDPTNFGKSMISSNKQTINKINNQIKSRHR